MSPAHPPAEARPLLASARIEHTPCGSGSIVWHAWTPKDGARAGCRPVLLLHGGSGSWTHWVRNIPALLDAGHSVLAPDIPGFGDSASPPGGQDADVAAVPLAEGLATLLPGPFQVVGFSFGTLVSVLLAERLARIERLVLLGAPLVPLPHGRGGAPMRDWRHLASPEERAVVHAHNLRTVMLHKAESITEHAVAIQAHNVARDRMRRRRLVTTSLFADTVAALTVPIWLLYGAEDAFYAGAWDTLRAAAEAQPAVQGMHTLTAAGHWVQYEAAEEVNRYLLDVLGAGSPALSAGRR